MTSSSSPDYEGATGAGSPAAPAGSSRRGAGAASLLLVSEAAWASLVVDALANGTPGPLRPSVDMPFLAFALPALAALLLLTLVGDRVRAGGSALARGAWRAAAGLGFVTGAALSAGIVAGTSAADVTWAAAFHPWALPLHSIVATRATTWAWVVSVLVWGRGSWLALSPPSLRHAATSLVLGAVVFLVVFGHQASATAVPFDRATGTAGWLLFVYFALGVTAAAWSKERDVARRVLRRAQGAPSGTWVVALVVPLALVALVAFLVGGAATVVGPAAAAAAHGVGAVLGAVGDWVFSHLPRIHIRPGHRVSPLGTRGSGHPSAHRVVTGGPTPLGIALACAGGLVALVVHSAAVRALVRWARRRDHRRAEVDDERKTVFSWGHLLDQLRRSLVALVARIARRVRPPAHDATTGARGRDAGPDDGDPVRAAYRRVLCAAREAHRGRSPDETPRELATRLGSAPELARHGASELRSLTALYERVRYAGADAARLAERAAADAEVLAGALVPSEEA